MKEFEGIALELEDDDFQRGHMGEIAFTNRDQLKINNAHLVIWRGRVLKNLCGVTYREEAAFERSALNDDSLRKDVGT